MTFPWNESQGPISTGRFCKFYFYFYVVIRIIQYECGHIKVHHHSLLATPSEMEVRKIILTKASRFVSCRVTNVDFVQILDFEIHRASLWISFRQWEGGGWDFWARSTNITQGMYSNWVHLCLMPCTFYIQWISEYVFWLSLGGT